MIFNVVSTYCNSWPNFARHGIVILASKQTRQFPGHTRRCQRRIPGQGTAAEVKLPRQTFWMFGRSLKIFDRAILINFRSLVSFEYKSKMFQ